jgi:hypothetical protein
MPLLRDELNEAALENKWTVHSWDRYGRIKKDLPSRQNAHILLADDFVGSGSTASQAVNYFQRGFGDPSDKILVVCLVAQEAAMTGLAQAGITCIASQTRLRGISDSVRLQDKATALGVMDGIEKRLKVSAKFRRGFGSSEALVSMNRCPNNTFPIYWIRQRKDGSKWPAPFPR